jgi:hypothetical protein
VAKKQKKIVIRSTNLLGDEGCGGRPKRKRSHDRTIYDDECCCYVFKVKSQVLVEL